VGACVCVGVNVVDVPFELVCEVASAGAVAEAGHVKCSSAARHGFRVDWGVNPSKDGDVKRWMRR
jgi:hypothetical protein